MESGHKKFRSHMTKCNNDCVKRDSSEWTDFWFSFSRCSCICDAKFSSLSAPQNSFDSSPVASSWGMHLKGMQKSVRGVGRGSLKYFQRPNILNAFMLVHWKSRFVNSLLCKNVYELTSIDCRMLVNKLLEESAAVINFQLINFDWAQKIISVCEWLPKW